MSQAGFGERQCGDLQGFSLVEVLISMGILTAVSIGLAQLFAISGRANLVARNVTSTTTLAVQKMEQLRALTWSVANDGSGLPISDTSSDLSITPAPSSGGRGLAPSPPNALDENVAGYCDFLDAGGGWVGAGTTPPSGAVYLRRWAIVPLPTNPHDTLILQVLVSPLTNERVRGGSRGPRRRMPGDALLINVKTRKSS
jgi:type II secretory pathway pseudopilin PulG